MFTVQLTYLIEKWDRFFLSSFSPVLNVTAQIPELKFTVQLTHLIEKLGLFFSPSLSSSSQCNWP